MYTTNRRVWEHDGDFKELVYVAPEPWRSTWKPRRSSPLGFANRIPTGALMLVSDQPMIPEGVKTEALDLVVTENYVETHIKVGSRAVKLVRRHGRSVKHLRFESEFDETSPP